MVGIRERGLSLIELMVTLTIMMVITLIAVPLTSGWVKNTHLNHAHDVILEGFATARALALQNPANATGTGTAASLVATGTTLEVTYPDATSVTVWSGSVDGDTTVTLNSTCSSDTTLTLLNTGVPATGNCPTYRISVNGGPSETGTLQ